MTCRPIANGAILEHLAKHNEKHRDKGSDHQEQDEHDAAAPKNRLEARRRVIAVIAIAAETKGCKGAKDDGEDPHDDIRNNARQNLGKNRGAEQLAQIGLVGLPNLLERKRALHAAGDRKVQHSGIAKHPKEDAQHKRDEQGKDEPPHRGDEGALKAARTIEIIRTDSTDHGALNHREHSANHRDSGDEPEHARNDRREDA